MQTWSPEGLLSEYCPLYVVPAVFRMRNSSTSCQLRKLILYMLCLSCIAWEAQVHLASWGSWSFICCACRVSHEKLKYILPAEEADPLYVVSVVYRRRNSSTSCQLRKLILYMLCLSCIEGETQVHLASWGGWSFICCACCVSQEKLKYILPAEEADPLFSFSFFLFQAHIWPIKYIFSSTCTTSASGLCHR